MEEIAAVANVPPIMEEIAAGAHLTPHEREQERIAVQSFAVRKDRIAKCRNHEVLPNKDDIAKVRQHEAKLQEFWKVDMPSCWFLLTSTISFFSDMPAD